MYRLVLFIAVFIFLSGPATTFGQDFDDGMVAIKNGNYDQATKDEIQSLVDAGKEEELTDAFYKDLELKKLYGPFLDPSFIYLINN